MKNKLENKLRILVILYKIGITLSIINCILMFALPYAVLKVTLISILLVTGIFLIWSDNIRIKLDKLELEEGYGAYSD